MDRYEINANIDEIKRLASKKLYKQASDIASNTTWNKVKDWSALSTAIEVFEQTGKIEEARDVAVLAYNRNLGGRKLVYKLTELLVKLEQFEDAEELYDEYEDMTSNDDSCLILFYTLRKAEDAPKDELIELLEKYKANEIDEKYAYELAVLYAENGRKKDAISVCDELSIMLQEGEYVDKAILLKQKIGGTVTGMQKNILEKSKQRKEDVNKTKEIMFERQNALATIQKDEIEDVFREEDREEDNQQSEDESLNDKQSDKTLSDSTIETLVGNDSEDSTVSQALRDFVLAKVRESENQNKNDDETVADENQETTEDEPEIAVEDELEPDNEIETGTESQIETEDMDIHVEIPENNIYDTQNLQDVIAGRMNEIMKDEVKETEEIENFRPSPTKNDVEDNSETEVDAEDEQIEGQLSIADWMESVREEKYGSQDTREFSKTELERILDEKEENSAAYEKLMHEKKMNMLNEKNDQKENEYKARVGEALDSARTDLAMRTGRAARLLEEAADSLKETVKMTQEIADIGTAEAVSSENEYSDENSDTDININSENENYKSDQSEDISEELTSTEETPEQLSLETADISGATDEIMKKFVNEELDNSEINSTDEESNEVSDVASDGAWNSYEAEEQMVTDDIFEDEPEEEKKLTGELAKIFRKYRELPGLEPQLAEFFENIDAEMRISDSSVGNIIISGNTSSDKVGLARTIVRALNYLYPDTEKKIAKTTGESINNRGISRAMPKLKGTALIVEGAGIIKPARIEELCSCLSQPTDRMIVILEDADAEMNVLLKFNPEMTKTFNHRIVLKQYTVNELVEMAKKFAHKRQYEVDDNALLELYLKIDQLHSVTDNIKLDDIKEIVNKAIARSEKRASKRFFGGLKKKRSEKGDIYFLTEADFKD